MAKPRTLYDKIWDAHVVETLPDGTAVLYIDKHLIHEVTSPQAFEGLRMAGRGLRHRQDLLVALDQPQATYSYDWNYPLARTLVRGLDGLNPVDLARLFAGHIPLTDLMT